MRWLAVFALFLLAGCQTEQTYVSFKPGTTAPDRQKAFRQCKATADEAMAAAAREDLYERDQGIMRCLEWEGYRAIQRPNCKTQSDRSKAYYQPQPDDPVQMKCSSGIAMELPATVSTPPNWLQTARGNGVCLPSGRRRVIRADCVKPIMPNHEVSI
jgi:hypothetical protein